MSSAGGVEDVRVCVLDVNETLSDLTALVPRLVEVGLDAVDLEPWFSGVLRDGFALTLLGRRPVFREVAAAGLRTRLVTAGVPATDEAVAHVLDGFAALSLHPDVAPGLRRMHERGLVLVPLTNGATAMSERMFADAGVLDLFAHRLSVEEVGPWKPHHAPYELALRTTGVAPERAVLVAVHPWDLAGAAAVGMRTAWIDREGTDAWPGCFSPPDVRASGVDQLAELLPAA